MMHKRVYQIISTCFILLYTINGNAQACLLVDRIDDFAGNAPDENNYWRDTDSGINFYGINSNETDSVLFDFIFKPYDWTCGSKLWVLLEDEETGKIQFDSTYTREDLKYLYLTKYQKYSDHLIIRLNFTNHQGLVFDVNRPSQFFRLKIEAIDNKGKSTLLYGKNGHKIFTFKKQSK
jgi:hypothetical protein